MAVRYEQITITIAAGATTGSQTSTRPIYGLLYAIHLDYTSIADTGADVTIATAGKGPPAQPIMVRSNSVTDGWFYPRAALHDATATPLTFDGTRAQTGLYPLCDYVTASVATADEGSILVTLVYTE